MTIQDTTPAPRQKPSPAAEIGWALASSALLAALIGYYNGWIWALAGVVGVFVHEYGHVLAINAAGVGPGRIRIIPFVGGAATMQRTPESDFKGVLIALAGPSFGLLAAIPFFLLAHQTGDGRWLGGAFFVGLINLINLAPAPPLDGSKALGPALARIHPLVEKAALILVGLVAVVLAVRTGNWIFGAFVGIATLGAIRAKTLRAPARPLSAAEWLGSVGLWLVALVLCMGVIAFASVGTGRLS
jgi:Zn-dependent protease